MVFEMHKELNIITLSGYYSEASYRGRQAQKPLIVLQHCHHTLNLCFKIPALMSQHSEEHLKFFRGNPPKSKHLKIKRSKDRGYYWSFNNHIYIQILYACKNMHLYFFFRIV